MATVYTVGDTRIQLAEVQQGIASLLRLLTDAEAIETYLKNGTTADEGTIDTRVQSLLTDADSQRDDIVTRLNRLNFQHRVQVRTGRDMTGVQIEATDNYTGLPAEHRGKTSFNVWNPGALRTTPYSGSPFSPFAVGDTIQVTGAEDSGNNVSFTVGYVHIESAWEVIVATAAVAGTVDNADDATAVFTLIGR